jgi:lysyl-tRNA synthetase class II
MRSPPARPCTQAQELREAGKEPYAYRFDRTHYTDDLQRQFEGLAAGERAPLVAARALMPGRRVGSS